MNNKLMCSSIAVLSLLGAGSAFAGGSKGTIGVGAETNLSGDGGLSLNYDAGEFHAGGFLSFVDEAGDNNTDIGLGGRFYWHLHSTPMSDFGLGANLGIIFDNDPTPPPDGSSNTYLYLEPAFQMRAFIAGNVAVSATAGIVIGLADADGVALGGQITGAAGIHYYFF
jgi:hypothetical protein